MPLEPQTVPQTPINSLATMESNHGNDGKGDPLNELMGTQLPSLNANIQSFSTRPSWKPPPESNLQWAWIEGSGPFITNGHSTNPHFVDSESESDTTAIMFNLDSLNESRPEAMQDQGWAKGCIPESPNSFIETLVQRVDRGRFRFELGDSSNGPGLLASQIGNSNSGAIQTGHQEGNSSNDIPTEEGPNVKDLGPFEQLTLGPTHTPYSHSPNT